MLAGSVSSVEIPWAKEISRRKLSQVLHIAGFAFRRDAPCSQSSIEATDGANVRYRALRFFYFRGPDVEEPFFHCAQCVPLPFSEGVHPLPAELLA